jgi:putative MFS transporter
MSTQAIASDYAVASGTASTPDALLARLERLPITRRLKAIRVIVGLSTFFDAYTIIAIAFALPQLTQEWVSRRRLSVLLLRPATWASCAAPCFSARWRKNRPYRRIAYHHHHVRTHGCGLPFCLERLVNSCYSLFTGVGIGAEVPVASAYINEFVGAKKRGRFFLLYEVIFPIGMMFAGLVGYFLVPIYGWKVMFLIGLVPPR